jgi:hypothetical protein
MLFFFDIRREIHSNKRWEYPVDLQGLSNAKPIPSKSQRRICFYWNPLPASINGTGDNIGTFKYLYR